MQLSLFDNVIVPGMVYTCMSVWVNEMGHKWKPGTKIEVIQETKYSSFFVRLASEQQLFEISMDTLKNHFSKQF